MTGIPFLNREPAKAVAGDTIKWTRTDLANFPADSWTLTYELRSVFSAGPPIKVTATADGLNHSVTILAAVSALWNAGAYCWDAYVTNGAERQRVDRGVITVEADLAQADATFDNRSDARKILDNLVDIISGKSKKDTSSYSIAGRSISLLTWDEIITAHDKYAQIVKREEDALRIEKGYKPQNKIHTRFV